ncbi:MAG: LysR family transcriptional regulator [Pseudomonadota bacterium]
MNEVTNVDATLLRCFVAVIDSGGFTAAGERLGLTQSGVSVRMRRLEDELDTRLLVRTSRRLELTGEGELLLGYARRILDLNDELVGRLKNPDLTGLLRIGVADYLAPISLGRILKRFRTAFPKMRMQILTGLGQTLTPAFDRGDLDLLIAGEGETLTDGQALFEEDLVWTGSNDGLSDGGTISLVTLPLPCRFRRAAIDVLERQNRPWTVSLQSESISGVHEGLRAGLGVSVLPVSAVPDDLERLSPPAAFDPLPSLELHAFSPKRRNRAADIFVEFLTEELLESSTMRRRLAA